MDWDKILKFKVVCIILPGGKFNEEIINLVKKIKNRKVCYVTLNKGADVFLESFKENKINSENFFFVDCVSKTIVNPKPIKNCSYVSSPNALTEMSLAINKCVDSGYSVILVDSISTFMIYHKTDAINHFFHNLSNKTRTEKDSNLVLTISNKDKESEVFKKIEIIVDEVLEIR